MMNWNVACRPSITCNSSIVVPTIPTWLLLCLKTLFFNKHFAFTLPLFVWRLLAYPGVCATTNSKLIESGGPFCDTVCQLQASSASGQVFGPQEKASKVLASKLAQASCRDPSLVYHLFPFWYLVVSVWERARSHFFMMRNITWKKEVCSQSGW